MEVWSVQWNGSDNLRQASTFRTAFPSSPEGAPPAVRGNIYGVVGGLFVFAYISILFLRPTRMGFLLSL